MAVTRDNEITPYSINYSYSIPIPPHLQSYQNNNQNQNQNHYELNQNHQNQNHYEPNQNHHYEPNQNHQRYQTRYSFELKSPSNYLNPTTPQTINFNQHNNNNNNFSPPFPTQFPTYSESNQTYLKSEPLISNELQSRLTPLPHHPTTTTNHQYHPNQNQTTTFSEITGSILKTDDNLIVSNPSLPNLNNINMTFWDPQGNWAPNLYQNNLSNLMNINSPFQDIHPITSPITTTTTNSQPFNSSHQLTPTLSIKKSDSNSSLRFQATLDAPTANNINIGDQPITYLNKSQYYTISLQDEQQSDCIIKTTIVLQFFKPEDRKEAHKNWERWLKLQSNSQSAQAVTIDPTNATGILSNPVTTYDRTTITWNGRHGAQFPIKINCLSTDFIEVKGVSGKPLRLVLHSNPTNSSEYSTTDSTNQQPEYSSAQLKIYRDKGAERKNMEGQNHPTKKFKSNHREELNATLSLYAPSYLTTTFYPLELDSYDEILNSFPPVTGPKPDHLPFTTTKIRDRKFNTLSGAEFPDLVDIDPSYIPHLRPPPPTSRCLLIKFPTDPLYRAIYLHTATVPELIAQVATKFQFQKGAIRSCTHRPSSSSSTSTPPTPLTDTTVAQFPEEMTLTVEVDHTDQAMALVFTY